MADGSLADIGDTIVAIASPTSPAPRGAVRLSGDSAMDIADALGLRVERAKSAHFVDCDLNLDEPLGPVPVRALIWPTARSYTGQPSLEIHTFGSLPVLQAIVDHSVRLGARPARPGEFTLRAFLAGRLDLTQAEAVLGVIEAEGRGSLDYALRQLSGNLSKPLESLRHELLDLLADVEAGLDFVDEDIQFISDEDLVSRLQSIAEIIEQTRGQLAERSRAKSEWIIALRGLPNAGKSRLLNRLVGYEAAVVADVAGTTRDVVTVPMQISGHDVIVIDTAGVESIEEQSSTSENTAHESALEEIARQAQSHASRAGRDADLRLWCADYGSPDWEDTARRMAELATEKRSTAVDLWVATKCDNADAGQPPEPWIACSSVTGLGIEGLRRSIAEQIESHDRNESGSVIGTAARCGASLRSAHESIEAAIRYVEQGDGHEYVSSEIRSAAHAIGEVTGAVYNDDILDRVFSRFCIGK